MRHVSQGQRKKQFPRLLFDWTPIYKPPFPSALLSRVSRLASRVIRSIQRSYTAREASILLYWFPRPRTLEIQANEIQSPVSVCIDILLDSKYYANFYIEGPRVSCSPTLSLLNTLAQQLASHLLRSYHTTVQYPNHFQHRFGIMSILKHCTRCIHYDSAVLALPNSFKSQFGLKSLALV